MSHGPKRREASRAAESPAFCWALPLSARTSELPSLPRPFSCFCPESRSGESTTQRPRSKVSVRLWPSLALSPAGRRPASRSIARRSRVTPIARATGRQSCHSERASWAEREGERLSPVRLSRNRPGCRKRSPRSSARAPGPEKPARLLNRPPIAYPGASQGLCASQFGVGLHRPSGVVWGYDWRATEFASVFGEHADPFPRSSRAAFSQKHGSSRSLKVASTGVAGVCGGLCHLTRPHRRRHTAASATAHARRADLAQRPCAAQARIFPGCGAECRKNCATLPQD